MEVQESNKPLFLFVGKSGSGKTTIANMLENNGYSQVQSYTTRPPRCENERGHIFISEEEYNQLNNVVAATLYNDYHYCTTLDQIQDADIYVVDPRGVETLLEHCDIINRPIYIFYFVASVYNRIQRMLGRNDSAENIIGRLCNDEMIDWEIQLNKIQIKSKGKMSLVFVGADQEIEEVYSYIKSLIKIYQEKHKLI